MSKSSPDPEETPNRSSLSSSILSSSTEPTKEEIKREIKKGNKKVSRGFSFFRRKKSDDYEKQFIKPLGNLKNLYKKSILPLEKLYKYEAFYSSPFTDSDLEAKPIVLCIGQYSTGKTSFIKFLLQRDFPGIRVGPEPTTDRFVAVISGKTEKIIPGNAAAAQVDKPFTGLKKFGMSFLNKFECSELKSPILDSITLIDTPGVLSGDQQTEGRSYSYIEVMKWFAERADRILIFFDSNKLDISQQMRNSIDALKIQEDKIICILNKADSVSNQQLMRVYGALMWSLGKTINTPEVPRVYISSFWDKPYKNALGAGLFNAEKVDLLSDLRSLKRGSLIRKINDVTKRVKTLKIHLLIIKNLKSQLGVFGKEKKMKKMLDHLDKIFSEIQFAKNVPKGDFPEPDLYRRVLMELDISKIKKIDEKVLDSLDQILSKDIPEILEQVPNEEDEDKDNRKPKTVKPENPFDNNNEDDAKNAFAKQGSIHDDGLDSSGWAISGTNKKKFDGTFEKFSKDGNDIPANVAKKLMLSSGLPLNRLKTIWDLSDIDKNNQLDRDEFAVCFHLIEMFKSGQGDSIGETLPFELIPPSKRDI